MECNVHVLQHMLSSQISTDYIIQEGTCFQRERGILQMAAYWNHCQEEERLYQTHSESNVQLRMSVRSFVHVVTSSYIFAACCSPCLVHFSQRDVSEGFNTVLMKTVVGTDCRWRGQRWLARSRGSAAVLLEQAQPETKMPPLLLLPMGNTCIPRATELRL